jgi:glycosyltransferase involved in cell wall biosynthesis
MSPLVSIIIPVYNGENYLREAIDSALAQTYKPIEVIVINDGSQDKTEDIALSYGKKIKYFFKPNAGGASALNMGIKKMQGDYFSWLSHDDLYRQDKIERQMGALVHTPKRIVYSDYIAIDKNGNHLAEIDIARLYSYTDLTFGLFPVLRQLLSGCSLLIHKSHFERVGVFNENLYATPDYDLWFRMLKGQRLIYINEALIMSREHKAQVTHRHEKSRAESDELWLYMLENVTVEDACKIDGSERMFWNNQVSFLNYTPYKNASVCAKSLNFLGG